MTILPWREEMSKMSTGKNILLFVVIVVAMSLAPLSVSADEDGFTATVVDREGTE
jgi:hypothetical protein